MPRPNRVMAGHMSPWVEYAGELEQRIHDAYEVYAGMEGVMPESDKEFYLVRCITQMARELEKGE